MSMDREENWVPYDEGEVWEQITKALEDEQWDFRTPEGIAQETGIDPRIVLNLLEQHPGEVRKSPDWSTPGRFLYTSKSRRPTFREILSDIQFFITGKSGRSL